MGLFDTYQNGNIFGWLKKCIAFLISPVIGMFAALPSLHTKASRLLLGCCFVVLGFSMVIPEYENEDFNFDSVRYRQMFEDVADNPNLTFALVFVNYLINGDSEDLLAPILFYFVGKCTYNYHILFGVIAVIFSFFMIKTLRYFVDEPNYNFSILCLVLLFLFTSNQILNINAFRFYIAMWVVMYGVFKVYIDHKKWFLILIALSPMIHASCLVLYPIFLLAWILRNHAKLLYSGVVICLLLSPLIFALIEVFVQLLPENLSSHFESYLDPEYIHHINKGGSGMIWIVRIFETSVLLLINAIVYFFARHYTDSIALSKCKNLYILLLVITAFTNITILVPSLGSRYIMYTLPLIAYIFLVCFAGNRKYNIWAYTVGGAFIAFFLFLPWNIYQIPCLRFYTKLWDADVLYQSPIILFFKYVIEGV